MTNEIRTALKILLDAGADPSIRYNDDGHVHFDDLPNSVAIATAMKKIAYTVTDKGIAITGLAR